MLQVCFLTAVISHFSCNIHCVLWVNGHLMGSNVYSIYNFPWSHPTVHQICSEITYANKASAEALLRLKALLYVFWNCTSSFSLDAGLICLGCGPVLVCVVVLPGYNLNEGSHWAVTSCELAKAWALVTNAWHLFWLVFVFFFLQSSHTAEHPAAFATNSLCLFYRDYAQFSKLR